VRNQTERRGTTGKRLLRPSEAPASRPPEPTPEQNRPRKSARRNGSGTKRNRPEPWHGRPARAFGGRLARPPRRYELVKNNSSAGPGQPHAPQADHAPKRVRLLYNIIELRSQAKSGRSSDIGEIREKHANAIVWAVRASPRRLPPSFSRLPAGLSCVLPPGSPGGRGSLISCFLARFSGASRPKASAVSAREDA
jgi:hypothetical protein